MLSLTDSSGTFVQFFVFYGWLQRLWPCTPPDLSWTPVDRLDSLDAPAPRAWTPLKLVLLNVLDPVTKPWESRLSLRFEAGTI